MVPPAYLENLENEILDTMQLACESNARGQKVLRNKIL